MQRRWKMMFDRRGDVLRCEQLDGPPCTNGLELYVVEERPVREDRDDGSGGDDPKPIGGSFNRGNGVVDELYGEEEDEVADCSAKTEPVAV